MGFTFLNYFFSSPFMTPVSSSLHVGKINIRTTTHGFGGYTLPLGDTISMDRYVGRAPRSFQLVLIELTYRARGEGFSFFKKLNYNWYIILVSGV